MINRYIVLLILAFSSTTHAQHWGDSLRVARTAFKGENFELAYEKFLAAQRLAPDNIDLSHDIATAAYRAEDYETAEQLFKGAATRGTKDTHKKWLNVGNSQLKQENLKGAIESYKNALRLDPSDDKARHNLAQAKRMLQDQESKQDQQQNENQNQDQNQDQDDGQKEDSSDQQNQEGQNGDDSSKENESSGNNTEDQQKKEDKQQAQQAKMTEKRIERMLDELLKKEMETKQKVDQKSNKKGEGTSSSGKSW